MQTMKQNINVQSIDLVWIHMFSRDNILVLTQKQNVHYYHLVWLIMGT